MESKIIAKRVLTRYQLWSHKRFFKCLPWLIENQTATAILLANSITGCIPLKTPKDNYVYWCTYFLCMIIDKQYCLNPLVSETGVLRNK